MTAMSAAGHGAVGLIGGIGHIAANKATARAPVSALAPFDFTALSGLWVLILSCSLALRGLRLSGVFAITFAARIVTLFDNASHDKVTG